VALLYIGTVILGMPEERFWHCTLRKLHALYAFHTRLTQQKSKRQEVSMYG